MTVARISYNNYGFLVVVVVNLTSFVTVGLLQLGIKIDSNYIDNFIAPQ